MLTDVIIIVFRIILMKNWVKFLIKLIAYFFEYFYRILLNFIESQQI